MDGTLSCCDYNGSSSSKANYGKENLHRRKVNGNRRTCDLLTYNISPGYQKSSIKTTENFTIYTKHLECIPKYKDKGLIFVLNKKEKCPYLRKVIKLMWYMAYTLYFLDTMHLLPNDTGISLKIPPWRYISPVKKPENRDYIIEPDWDSRGNG